MAAKSFAVCATILLIQSAFGQVIPASSTVTGNTLVSNDIYLNNPSQLSTLGLAGLGTNLAGSGLAGSTFGSGLAGFGSGFGSLASGFGSGLAGSSLGTGLASSGLAASGLAGSSLANLGSNLAGTVATSPLQVTSISPIAPTGLAVASENVLEGLLAVNGQLPFLSAVAFEGPLPTSGSGVATCGCGSEYVGIVGEGFPTGQSLPNTGLGVGRVY